MAKRQYYSTRSGNAPLAEGLDLVNVLKLFLNMYRDWNYKGYFQDSFGIECQDSGHIPGRLGSDIEGAMLLAIRKPNLWPIYGNVPKYSEDDFFDVVEFLYDHIDPLIMGFTTVGKRVLTLFRVRSCVSTI
jgi:hypothetical protein